ncbi:MAG: flagellar basal body-associated FliL family protein [Armatimonadota bacterium]|nr:flagellar basal body-associated FliL family protein [Armatimonadota bacterium]MDR5704374.1 flagellar basal body-associated FliL family protein [Armatimonadota bacterium]MDR7435768.1 flagellar basal body-associated FliL family protein [Armatimonadota bacterium]
MGSRDMTGASKILVILIVVFALLGAAATGGYLALSSGGKKEKPEEVERLPLGTFVVNLRPGGGFNYLKVTIGLEVRGHAPKNGGEGKKGGLAGVVEEHKLELSDVVVSTLTGKTFTEMHTPEGKQQLRSELMARMNQRLKMTGVRVTQVFFAEFVAQ